jgi:hypothetical protein
VDSYPAGVHYYKMIERVGRNFFTPKAKPVPEGDGESEEWSFLKMKPDDANAYKATRVPTDWLWINDSPDAAKESAIPAHHFEGSVIGYPLDTFNREPMFHEHNLSPLIFAARVLLDETRGVLMNPVRDAVESFTSCVEGVKRMTRGECAAGHGIGIEAVRAFMECEWAPGLGLQRWAASAMNSELSKKLSLPSPDEDAGASGLLEKVRDAIEFGRYEATLASISAKALQWAAGLVTSSTDHDAFGSTGSRMVLPFSAEEIQLLANSELGRAGASGVAGRTPSPLHTALSFLTAELTEVATPTILLAAANDGVAVSKRQQLAGALASALLVHEPSVTYPAALADCVVRQTSNVSCVRALATERLHSSAGLHAVPLSLQTPLVELDVVAVRTAIHALANEHMAGRRQYIGRPTPVAMSEAMRTRALPISGQAAADFPGAFFAALEPHVPLSIRSAVFPVPDLTEVARFVREEVPSGLNAAFGIPSTLSLATITADATAMDLHAKAAASPPSVLLDRLMLQESTAPLARTLGTCNTANTSATCNLQAVSKDLLRLAGYYIGNETSVGVDYGLSVELGAAIVHAASFGDTAHMLQSLGHAVNASAIGVDGDFVAAALVASMGFTAYTDADAAASSSTASTISATSAQRKAQLAAAPALATQTARFLAQALNISGSTNSSSSSSAVPFMISKRALEASPLLLSELESFAVAILAKTWNPGAPSSIRAAKNAILATGTSTHSSTMACTASSPTLTPGDSFCSAPDLGVAALHSSFAASSLRNIRSSALLLPAGIGSTTTRRSSPMPVQVRVVVQALLEQLEYSTFSSTSIVPPTPTTSTTTGADVQTAINAVLVERLNIERPLTNDTRTRSVDTWTDFIGHALGASTSLVLGQAAAQEQLDMLLPTSSAFARSALVDHALDVSLLNFTFSSASRTDSAALAAGMYTDVLTMSRDALTTAHMCTTTDIVKGVEDATVTNPCWSAADAAGGSTWLTKLLQAAVGGDAHDFIDSALMLAKELLTTTDHGNDPHNPKAYARMSTALASAVITLDGPTIANVTGTSIAACTAPSAFPGNTCPTSWGTMLSSVAAGDAKRAAICQPRSDKVFALAAVVMTQSRSNCGGLCWPRMSELDTIGGPKDKWMGPLINGVLESMILGEGEGGGATQADVMASVGGQLSYDPMQQMAPPEFPRGVVRPTHQFSVGQNVRGFALVTQFRTVYVALTRCEITGAKDCKMEFHAVDVTGTDRIEGGESVKTWSDGNTNWGAMWLQQDDTFAIDGFTRVFKAQMRRSEVDKSTGKKVGIYSYGDNGEIPNTLWPRSSVLTGARAKYWWSIPIGAKVLTQFPVPMGIHGIAFDWREIADHLYVVMTGASKENIDQVESMGLQVDDGYYKLRPPIIETFPLNVSANEISFKALKFYSYVPVPTWIVPPRCIIKKGDECDPCKCLARRGGCKAGAGTSTSGCSKKQREKIDEFEKLKAKEKEDKETMENQCDKNCKLYCRCTKKMSGKSKSLGLQSKKEAEATYCVTEKSKCKGKCSAKYFDRFRARPSAMCKSEGSKKEPAEEEAEKKKEDNCDAACEKANKGKICNADCGQCVKDSPVHKECLKKLEKDDATRQAAEDKEFCTGTTGDFTKCLKCLKCPAATELPEKHCSFCVTWKNRCKDAIKRCKPGAILCSVDECGETDETLYPTEAPTSFPTQQKKCSGNDIANDNFRCGPGFKLKTNSVKCGLGVGCTKAQCCDEDDRGTADPGSCAEWKTFPCKTNGLIWRPGYKRILCSSGPGGKCTEAHCCYDLDRSCESHTCTGDKVRKPKNAKNIKCLEAGCSDVTCCDDAPDPPAATCGVGPGGGHVCRQNGYIRCSASTNQAPCNNRGYKIIPCAGTGSADRPCRDNECCYQPDTKCDDHTCGGGTVLKRSPVPSAIRCEATGCNDRTCCEPPAEDDEEPEKLTCGSAGGHTCRGAGLARCASGVAVSPCQGRDYRTLSCKRVGCTDAECCYNRNTNAPSKAPTSVPTPDDYPCNCATGNQYVLAIDKHNNPRDYPGSIKFAPECTTLGCICDKANKNANSLTYTRHGCREKCRDPMYNKAYQTYCGAGAPIPTRPLTDAPTSYPTDEPTTYPTDIPTSYPTIEPTKYPTEEPTKCPTKAPTKHPTKTPTSDPTKFPTSVPTEEPTSFPTKAPTDAPTKAPTKSPTDFPTQGPSNYPTHAPTEQPTKAPSLIPTPSPTSSPTPMPTNAPTAPKCLCREGHYKNQILRYRDGDYMPECANLLEPHDTKSDDGRFLGNGYARKCVCDGFIRQYNLEHGWREVTHKQWRACLRTCWVQPDYVHKCM